MVALLLFKFYETIVIQILNNKGQKYKVKTVNNGNYILIIS